MKKVDFRYLSQEDIMGLDISINEIIDVVEKGLIAHSNKQIEMPPKPGIHTRDGAFIHAMPAWIKDQDICGLKWVSGYPENSKLDLPSIAGLMILNDCETGMPLSVMDCRWLTAARTAAMTAITAKYCAKKDSQSLAVIGAGVQGTINALMLHAVMPELKIVYAQDLNEETRVRFAKYINEKTGLEVITNVETEEAIRKSDFVLTATENLKKPFIPFEWLKEGVCACGLEAARAFNKDVIENIDKFVTDDWGQTSYWLKTAVGAFAATPDLYAEIGDIVSHKKASRVNDKERFLVINIGMAIDDVALAALIYKKAVEKEIGKDLTLMENDKMF